MNDLEIKRLAKPFRVQTTDAARTFAGHGSVFDDPHPTSSWALPMDWLDVVKPGAFKKTLAEHKRRGTAPAMLFQHDWDNVVGAYQEVGEDEDGLDLKGKLAASAKTPAGADLYELVSMGALTGLSIGFRPMKVKLDEKAKTREILEVELHEVSLVTIPGAPSARIQDVKSADPTRIKRRIEDALRDAGLSRQEAKALIADGFKGLSLRDAAAEDDEARSAVLAAMSGVTDTYRRAS